MASTKLLTSDDLLRIAASDPDSPREVTARLIEAVEQKRLADPADAALALMIAADLSTAAGDLPETLALTERAVETSRAHGATEWRSQAFRAKILLRLGRADEAIAKLAALRPVLAEDPEAVPVISSVLVDNGYAETAEEWLTEALATTLKRQQALATLGRNAASDDASILTLTLLEHRHELRRDLGLPHDEHDDLADHLQDAITGSPSEPELGVAEVTTSFWPRQEFERLLERWPALSEEYGENWESFREELECGLARISESEAVRITLVVGSVDGLVDYAARHGGDPADPEIRDGYADHLADTGREIAWPPGRNDRCWCGSGAKYKKCCLPRSRR